MNIRSIEARLSQVEARHQQGESEWEKRIAWKKDWTMRKTVEKYGDTMIESDAADGVTTTMEELFSWADEYDALPVKPTLEELLKDFSEAQ